MSQHVFKVGDTIKMSNLTFQIRKITKKDLILRQVKPPVTAQGKQSPEQSTEQKTEVKTTEGKVTEEDLFEKTF